MLSIFCIISLYATNNVLATQSEFKIFTPKNRNLLATSSNTPKFVMKHPFIDADTAQKTWIDALPLWVCAEQNAAADQQKHAKYTIPAEYCHSSSKKPKPLDIQFTQNAILFIINQYCDNFNKQTYVELARLGLSQIIYLGDYMIAEYGKSKEILDTCLYDKWYSNETPNDVKSKHMRNRVDALERVHHINQRLFSNPIELVKICEDFESGPIMDCHEYTLEIFNKGFNDDWRRLQYQQIEKGIKMLSQIKNYGTKPYLSLLYFKLANGAEAKYQQYYYQLSIKSDPQNAYYSYYNLAVLDNSTDINAIEKNIKLVERAKSIKPNEGLFYFGLAYFRLKLYIAKGRILYRQNEYHLFDIESYKLGMKAFNLAHIQGNQGLGNWYGLLSGTWSSFKYGYGLHKVELTTNGEDDRILRIYQNLYECYYYAASTLRELAEVDANILCGDVFFNGFNLA